ncbi:hypothetical protein ACFXPY_12920 [Streptomyces sp. NPDC059153]|uniref:hypothetical protein n=1 Tax=Streptomyces sp. NPDC059153 TaxID=3346743 RepID=UPI00368FAAD2
MHGREHGGLARTFYPGFDDLPASEWNMARFMFLNPDASELTLEFEALIPPGAPAPCPRPVPHRTRLAL